MAEHDADTGNGTDDGADGRSMWSGTISFGLVSIPVALLPAVRSARVRMRMLDRDGTPLRRRYECPAENVEVHPEHIVRGYEIAPEQHVVVRDEELEELEPRKSRDIDLRRFVDVGALEPVYFDRPYFLVPSGDSTKAYRLLAAVMERTQQAGIATFVMRDTEYLVAILAEGGILRAETMRFADEIRTPEDVGLPERREPAKEQVDAMRRAIRTASADGFDPGELVDEYSRMANELVQRKLERNEDVVEAPEYGGDGDAREPASDLVAALRASLGVGRGRRGRDGSPPGRSQNSDRKGKQAPARRGRSGDGGTSNAPPIPSYDELTVREVRDRVDELTDVDAVRRLDEYERRHKNRKTVHELLQRRRAALKGSR